MLRNLAAASVVLLAQTSVKATNYASTASGYWRVPSTWVPSGIPGCGDTVTIQNGHTIELDDGQKVTSVTVQSGGQLNLVARESSGGQLTFCATGSASLAIYTVNGVDLRGAGTELRFERSLTIAGNGSLRGRESDAALVLVTSDAADVVLTSTIPIHGALTIKESGGGEGFFYNIGGVSADAAGKTLELHSSLDGVSDFRNGSGSCIAPMWSVMASGAVLRFGTPASLEGDFRVGPGTLDIDAPVHTDGKLAFASGGVITPNPLACFSYGGHCGGCQLFPWIVCLPVRCY